MKHQDRPRFRTAQHVWTQQVCKATPGLEVEVSIPNFTSKPTSLTGEVSSTCRWHSSTESNHSAAKGESPLPPLARNIGEGREQSKENL